MAERSEAKSAKFSLFTSKRAKEYCESITAWRISNVVGNAALSRYLVSLKSRNAPSEMSEKRTER